MARYGDQLTMNKDGSLNETQRKSLARKVKFLDLFVAHGDAHAACVELDVHKGLPRYWEKNDPEFAAAWQDARKALADKIAAALYIRGVDGVEEPVFYKGAECGAVRKYSDTAAMFLAKGYDPETFRERHDHRVLVAQIPLEEMTDEQLLKIVEGKDGDK